MRESHLSLGKMGINNLINDVINDNNYTWLHKNNAPVKS